MSVRTRVTAVAVRQHQDEQFSLVLWYLSVKKSKNGYWVIEAAERDVRGYRFSLVRVVDSHVGIRDARAAAAAVERFGDVLLDIEQYTQNWQRIDKQYWAWRWGKPQVQFTLFDTSTC